MWVLLALFGLPLLEIGLFVEIGGWLGLWGTLGEVLLTIMLGATVLRSQGARAQTNLRAAMEGIGNPAVPLAHEALILLAGGLLMLPGFFTDTLGLLLLLPPVRALAIARLKNKVVVQGYNMQQPRRADEDGSGTVIEGEFLEVDPKNPSSRGDSGWTRH
ncbi:hypothetical protein CKO11_06375 [Rhodobacter sp. TJ_12]|uniref:FxsA family protein n=1 Tax=Rhodobacter sp. TJ_12 TaxID=2029399 RepID=UPI001CBF9AE2|nr:FxsA family protein [Rhodobacter sp. TJ_12]MBZ4022082.1 hypothetical protein [Rhodobacter sp. TJ_12]